MRLNFFCDIDGTLLPFGKAVPESAVSAIERARKDGHRFFLSTGRSLSEIDECLRTIPFDGGVYSNGATVIEGGKTLRAVRMTGDDKSFLMNYASDRGILYMMQTNEGTFMSRETFSFFEESMMEYLHTIIPVPNLITYDTLPSSLPPVIKFLFLSPSHALMKARKEIGHLYQMVDNTDGLPQTDMVEVCLKGLDKGTGMKDMLSFLGEDISSSVAVGDGANDIEMVSSAGLGIAMGNGAESLKKVADWVSDSVERDGFRKAVEYAVRMRG